MARGSLTLTDSSCCLLPSFDPSLSLGELAQKLIDVWTFSLSLPLILSLSLGINYIRTNSYELVRMAISKSRPVGAVKCPSGVVKRVNRE